MTRKKGYKMSQSRGSTVREAVLGALKAGNWLTIQEIADNIDVETSETSISSSVRDLRKPKYGGYSIAGRRHNGVFEYRMGETE